MGIKSLKTAIFWELKNNLVDLILKKKGKMIKRILEEKLKNKIDYTKAIILLGPRQVGKTTLVKSIAQSTNQKYMVMFRINVEISYL